MIFNHERLFRPIREERLEGAVRCSDAKRILLLTRIGDVDDFDKPEIGDIQARLAKLPAGYDRLLERHARLHRAAMERMAVDLDQFRSGLEPAKPQ